MGTIQNKISYTFSWYLYVTKMFWNKVDNKNNTTVTEEFIAYKKTAVKSDERREKKDKQNYCITTLSIPKNARLHLPYNPDSVTINQDSKTAKEFISIMAPDGAKCRVSEAKVIKNDCYWDKSIFTQLLHYFSNPTTCSIRDR